MDVQQMKAQAKEEKIRRQIERSKLARERQMREELEREKAALEERLIQYQEEVRIAKEALQRSEESADLLMEKSLIADQEARLLNQKATEAENELQVIKLSVIKSEEEKLQIESKARETEHMVSRLVEESDRRRQEADQMKKELEMAREAERAAKEKLLSFLSNASLTAGAGAAAASEGALNGLGVATPASSSSVAASSALVPLTTSHGMSSYSANNVSLLANGNLNGGAASLIAHSNGNALYNQLHHPPPDYFQPTSFQQQQRPGSAASPPISSPINYEQLPMVTNGLNSLSFSSGSGGGGSGAIANGTSMGELLNTSVITSGASQTLMSDSGKMIDILVYCLLIILSLFQLFPDLQDLSLEIEKERHEYLEKSKHLQEQLKTLKSEIEELKVDDRVSVLDQLHKEQQESGDNKYSTIQKVKRGSTQSRVAFFEEL